MEQFLGDYKILRKLGAGPLGTALVAEHRFIKKQYLLKVLPAELTQEEAFYQRFEAEVAKLALLDHPHIVKVHSVTQVEGQFFLVTEPFLDAVNLATFMQQRNERLQEEELLLLARQLAEALDYAHLEKGVMHHCLKLNNILLDQTSKGICALISDFGLSPILSPGNILFRSLQTLSVALSRLPHLNHIESSYSPLPILGEELSTLSQAFLQGYAFLAPEQKRGKHAEIYTDSYAFGVLIYFLIAGHFPEGIFPLPSEMAPEFHYDWDTLILNCLQQEPKRRPLRLLPLLGNRKNRNILKQPLEEMGEQQSRSLINEETLQPASLEMRSQALEKEGSALKPIIHRCVENTLKAESQLIASSSAGVMLAEGSSRVLESREEVYAHQLNALLNRDPVITQYQPQKRESHTVEPLQSEMVVIQGGHFFRGSNSGHRDEAPRHRIALDAFALDIHPVTNEQFMRFLECMGSEKDYNCNDLIRLKDSRMSRSGGKLSIESGYAQHPVVGVTWYGATAYAKWVGKRLPTEAEWETAASSGREKYLFPTGESIDKGQANFFSSETTPVMSYAPNDFGLYDMAGNVYEWCHDWYGYNYYETSSQEPKNPKGPPQGVYRVLRGGCWKSLQEDLRCSHRHRNNPGTVNGTYGFRCAADA